MKTAHVFKKQFSVFVHKLYTYYVIILFHRKERPHKGAGKNVKLVVINGMLYKSSGHSLVKTNQSQTHLKESPLVVKSK